MTMLRTTLVAAVAVGGACSLPVSRRRRRRRRRAPAAAAADQPRPPRLPRRHGRPRRSRPGTRRTGSPRSRRSACSGPTPTATDDGTFKRVGGGAYDAGDRHLRPGRVQRRRHGPRGRRLPAPLEADRQRDQPARGVRDAARPHLPADHDRRRTPATSCCGCSPTARSTRAPSRSSSRTRPTATRRTGWPGRSGRWARGTPPSSAPTPRSPGSSRSGWTWRSPRSTGRCSTRYGQYLDIDGERTPAWLIVDGADASAEAVLGLAAYVRGRRDRRRPTRADPAGRGHHRDVRAATRATGRSAASCRGRCPDRYWHAWGSQMPAALAPAAAVTGDRAARRAPPATRSRSTRGCSPPGARTTAGARPGSMRTQIAYGVDSRVQSLLARPAAAADQLAGIVGGVVLRRQRLRASRRTTRPPASPFDGIAGDGTVNRNSGAESTIHGLLTMLALDAHPDVTADRADRRRAGPGRRRPTSRPRTPAHRWRDRGDAAVGRGPVSRSTPAPATLAAGRAAPRPSTSASTRPRWSSRWSTCSRAARRSPRSPRRRPLG